MKKPDKVSPKIKEAVRKFVQNHRYNMYLEHYAVDVEYMAEDHKYDKSNHHVQGEMVVDRRYLRATLKLYPKAYKSGDLDHLEEVVSHEIAHLSTQHMYDLVTACYKDEGETLDAWESLTENIARLSRKIQSYENKKKK